MEKRVGGGPLWQRRDVWAAVAALVLIYHAWMIYIAYVHFIGEAHGSSALAAAAAARSLPVPLLVESVHAAQLELELLRREQKGRVRSMRSGRDSTDESSDPHRSDPHSADPIPS